MSQERPFGKTPNIFYSSRILHYNSVKGRPGRQDNLVFMNWAFNVQGLTWDGLSLWQHCSAKIKPCKQPTGSLIRKNPAGSFQELFSWNIIDSPHSMFVCFFIFRDGWRNCLFYLLQSWMLGVAWSQQKGVNPWDKSEDFSIVWGL